MTMRQSKGTLRNLVLVTVLACWAAAWGGAGPPAPPEPDYPVLGSFLWGDGQAAGELWQPMHESGQASALEQSSRKVLRMPCNFRGTDMPRASWDRDFPLDLAAKQGVQFLFYCGDPSPAASFNIYFRSGSGWYSTLFSPGEPGRWHKVRIDKEDMNIEGKPAGWAHIDRVRISAWRALDEDTEFYLAGMGILGADAHVAVVRGEYAAAKTPSEARTLDRVPATVAGLLREAGVSYVTLSDLDLNAERLRPFKAVILPYNPVLPGAAVQALEDFAARGGGIIGFYNLPKPLMLRMGVGPGSFVKAERPGYFASIRPLGNGLKGMPEATGQHSWNIHSASPMEGRSRVVAWWHDESGNNTGHPAVIASDRAAYMTHILLADDPLGKRMLLLSMLAHVAPESARQAAEAKLAGLGSIGGYGSMWEAVRGIERSAAADKHAAGLAKPLLEHSQALEARARRLLQNGDYLEAVKVAGESHAELVKAYCAVQRSEPGEHRSWWCHSAWGVEGMRWDEAVRLLAENGFTAVLPNMLWGGSAFYESEVLPVHPAIHQERDGVVRGDQIAECLAACRKYGVECHVWKVNWNMGGTAPKAFRERMRREGRVQASFDGTVKDTWLCPSHPANQQLEIDAMVEVATKYPVDGIHFDYIRYPDENHCFCAGCRERFENVLGERVTNWPRAIRENEKLEAEWNEFRRNNITRVVAEVSRRARAQRPDIEISAAVFRNWTIHRDTIGQDWKVWCEKGYLDFVCPMDYMTSTGQFRTIAKQQEEWAGDVPCYPGIGLSTWPDRTDIGLFIDQVLATREVGTGGFTVFNYGVTEAEHIVPLAGMGLTRPE